MRRLLLASSLLVFVSGCAANTPDEVLGPKDFVVGKITKVGPNNVITVDTKDGDYVIEVAFSQFGSPGVHTVQNTMSAINEGDQVRFPREWVFLDRNVGPVPGFIRTTVEHKKLFSPFRVGVISPNDIALLDRELDIRLSGLPW